MDVGLVTRRRSTAAPPGQMLRLVAGPQVPSPAQPLRAGGCPGVDEHNPHTSRRGPGSRNRLRAQGCDRSVERALAQPPVCAMTTASGQEAMAEVLYVQRRLVSIA